MQEKNIFKIALLIGCFSFSTNSHAVFALEPSQWVNIAQNVVTQIKSAYTAAKSEIIAAKAIITESNTYKTAMETTKTAMEAYNTVQRLKQHYDVITGNYNFGGLLNAANDRTLRRYMPEDYNSTVDAINGSSLPSDMAALEGAIHAYKTRNALYTTIELFDDPSSLAAQQYSQRFTRNMTLSSLAHTSLGQTNMRYRDIELLIDKIDTADAPKAAWDLGNRINAQNALLMNEKIRLQALLIRQNALAEEQKLKDKAVLIRVATSATDWEAN